MRRFMFISFVCAELLSGAVTLTPQESEYLKTHPVIKVHNEKSWAPFNFNENDTPKGLSIDFMNLVAQKTGLKVEYVTGTNWNDFLEMMKNGSLDVMLNIVKNDEREKFLSFTNPYQLVPHCIVAKVSDTREYKKYEDILDKKIAIGIGGESGSGKSVTAYALQRILADHNIQSVVIQMDDYFILPPKLNHENRFLFIPLLISFPE